MAKRTRVSGGRVRVKAWSVMEECVERGVEHGYNRARKHTDKPLGSEVRRAIYDAVLTEISEWFEFN